MIRIPVGISKGMAVSAVDTMRMMTMACFAVACFGGGGSGSGDASDRDNDGLTDVEEAMLGSNPDAADTDRDGWDDLIEVESFTDPLNGFDHPYTGGWTIAECRADVGTGGGVAPAFSLMDQHGDPVRLHDFCDRAVVLASAAVWCQPCQTEAVFLQRMFEEYADDGLMVITLLGEDANNRTPSLDVLNEWVDAFDLTYPVLQDTSFSVTAGYTGNYGGNLPTNQMIGDGAIIQRTNLPEITEADIVSLLGL